jgi:hypothetical protein
LNDAQKPEKLRRISKIIKNKTYFVFLGITDVWTIKNVKNTHLKYTKPINI